LTGVFVTVLVRVWVTVELKIGVAVCDGVAVTNGVLVTDDVDVDDGMPGVFVGTVVVGGHRNGSVMQMSTVGVAEGGVPIAVFVRVAVLVSTVAVCVDVSVFTGVSVTVLVDVFTGTGVRTVGPRFDMPGTPQKMSDAPMKAPAAFRGRTTAHTMLPRLPGRVALRPLVVTTPSVNRLHTM